MRSVAGSGTCAGSWPRRRVVAPSAPSRLTHVAANLHGALGISIAGRNAILHLPLTASDYDSRNAESDGVSVDVLGDNGSGPDHGTISNSDSAQYFAARTDPNVLANADSLSGQRLRLHLNIELPEAVIRWDDDSVRCDHGVRADSEPSMSIQNAIRADVSVRRDLDCATIGGDDDAVGNDNAFRDENPPPERAAIGVRLDPRGIGNVSGRRDLDPSRSV